MISIYKLISRTEREIKKAYNIQYEESAKEFARIKAIADCQKRFNIRPKEKTNGNYETVFRNGQAFKVPV